MTTIPFANERSQCCGREPDCALVLGHEGNCYPTELLYNCCQRVDLREARGALCPICNGSGVVESDGFTEACPECSGPFT